MDDLGTILRRRRLALEMSTQDVGDFLGVNAATVWRWEKGDQPTPTNLAKIARLYKLPLSALIEVSGAAV